MVYKEDRMQKRYKIEKIHKIIRKGKFGFTKRQIDCEEGKGTKLDELVKYVKEFRNYFKGFRELLKDSE